MSTLPASEFRVGIAMKCGCAAAGTLKRPGQPALVGCGLHDCTDVVDTRPSLEGRTAKCSYGGKEIASSWSLAFFQHRPGQAHDAYYCGCFGWD